MYNDRQEVWGSSRVVAALVLRFAGDRSLCWLLTWC